MIIEMTSKNIILSVAFTILVVATSFTQNAERARFSDISATENHSKDQYLTDSTYFYVGNESGSQWYQNKIYRVAQRNAANNVILAYDYENDSEDRAWFQQRRYQGSFLNDTIRKLWQSWVKNTNTNEWLLADSIHFNIHGSPTVSWYKVWDPFMNSFVEGKLSEFFYNDDGILHLTYNHYWDTAVNNWQRANYKVNYYNQYGLDSLNEFYYWNGINWIKDQQTHYSYSPKLFLEEELQKTWNGVEWENSRKIVFGYSNDLIEDILVYNWQPDLNDWFNYGLTGYVYNPDETVHQVTEYLWGGSEWLNTTRKTYTYNPNQQPLEILNELWSFSSETWQNLSLNVYSYDNISGNREEFSFFTWNTDQERWIYFYRERNFWGFYPSPSIPEIDQAGFNILPNPSNGLFQLGFNNQQQPFQDGILMIYTTNGHLIKTLQINHSQSTINATDLSPGAYQLVLRSKNGVFRQSLIISK